jgi:O-antigen ligase
MIYLIIPLLFVSVSWFTYDPINIVFSSVLLLLSVLSLVLQRNYQYHKSVFLIAPLSLPLFYLVSGLQSSQSMYSIFTGGYQRNFGVLTFFALGIIFLESTKRQVNLNKFISSLLVALIIANIYGYMQIAGIDPLPWTGLHTGIILTLGNPNFAGAFLGILSSVPLVKFFQSKNFYTKCAFIVLFVSTVFLGLQSNALQSQLLTLLGCLIIIYILQINNQNKSGKIVRILTSGSILISVIFTSLLFSTNIFRDLKSQIFSQSSIPQRLDYWRTGIQIFFDNPIFGVGPDEYHRYAAIFRTPQQLMRDGYMAIPDKAHNVFIDHFTNGGLLAGVLWLVFVLSVSYAGVRLIQNIRNYDKFNLSIIISIWVTYIVQALISPDQIILTVIGFVSGGIIVGKYLSGNKLNSTNYLVDKSATSMSRSFFGLVFILSLIFVGKTLWYDAQVNKIILGQLNDKPAIISIINSNFASAKTVELIGVMKIREKADCSLIVDISERLLELDDRSSQAWYMKAICANQLKNFSNAKKYVENSLKFDPLNVNYLLGKAELEIFQMKKLNASNTLDKIRSINPSDPQLLQLQALLK